MNEHAAHRSNTPDRPAVDVQIVGAGLAGLLAANLAADAGLTVRLVERTADTGGRADSADHHGYALNLGPHALYLQGALRRTLVDLGVDHPGSPPDAVGGTASLGARRGLLPAGPGSLLRTNLLGARAKFDLARLMARIPRIDPTRLATTSVAEWIDGATGDPDLRLALRGIVNIGTYNAAADLASADAAVSQLQMAIDEGVRYVDGGWRTIVQRLSDRADRIGVERMNATVTAVEPRRRGQPVASDPASPDQTAAATTPATTTTTIVTADGDRFPAGATIVAAGGPAVADRLLALAGTQQAIADAVGPAVEASAIDLGVERRPEVGAHFGLDTRLYASVHSVAAGVAPTGRHLVTAALYRLPGEATSPDDTRARLLDHAVEMGVDPDTIEVVRYLHRLTVAGGMPLAARGGLAGRPGVRIAGRPGVLVAGDWVGPTGLLADAAAASAAAAVAVVANEGVSIAAAVPGRPTVTTADAPAPAPARARLVTP
ncbi:MAG: NAD(P)-binding protein [Actinomycetota bacterium]